MSNLESNKIFAALLVAGIVGMMTGFIAKKIVVTDHLEEDAFPIEVAEAAGAKSTIEKPKGPEPILAMIAEADITRGEKLSKACAACHSFDKGGANRIGPNLWNVVNAAKGTHAGFTYSSTMAAFGGQWGYKELNHFLWKPKDYMSGTKMNYIGLRKAKDRAAIIAWMRTLHDTPQPLPTAEEIAAESGATEESEEAATPDAPAEETQAPATDAIDPIVEEALNEAAAIIDMDPFDPAALNAIESAAGNVEVSPAYERIYATKPTAQDAATVLQGIEPAAGESETPVIEEMTITSEMAVPVESVLPVTDAEAFSTIEPAAGLVEPQTNSMEAYRQHVLKISNMPPAPKAMETPTDMPIGNSQ